MNTDIRVDVAFLDHWKTETLAFECGADGVLCLMRLWVFAAQNKPDGRLTGIKAELIERVAKWRGEPGKLFKCLAETRFIEQDDDGIWCLHDWQQHNPYAASAEWRHERAKKANAARRDKESRYKRATSALVARSKPAPSPSPSPAPAPIAFFSSDDDTKPAPPPAPKKEKKAAGLADGWQPQAETVAVLTGYGIPETFVAGCVPHFRLHHREAGTVANGFESAFVGWARKAWQTRNESSPPITERPRGVTVAEWMNHQARAHRLLEDDPLTLPALEYSHAH